MPRSPSAWTALATHRLQTALALHGLASARTLEQKISDAGPFNQRIDPHILTQVRNDLIDQGIVKIRTTGQARWYHLAATPETTVSERLAELEPLHLRLQEGDFFSRVGQALEIAVYRSLTTTPPGHVLGAYLDLEAHDDSTLYQKEEPPSSVSGKQIAGARKLDFLLVHPSAGPCGIEIKNIREWLYPNRDEIREMLLKCCQIDAVPILIGRRIPFVTFRLLNTCGVVVHQTYRQRYPAADAELAALVRDKRLLAYHDVVTGNQPDTRLDKFVGTNLPKILSDARAKFAEYYDLLSAYATKKMPYAEFAARVRRRRNGQNEDDDFDPNGEQEF